MGYAILEEVWMLEMKVIWNEKITIQCSIIVISFYCLFEIEVEWNERETRIEKYNVFSVIVRFLFQLEDRNICVGVIFKTSVGQGR
jgi:uncharacterized membrane protein